MEREEIMNCIYTQYDEDSRLTSSRHGQLEYRTTLHYIHKLIPAGSRILEVGAGTGRYSAALAREGYTVSAVELVEHNLEILKRNAAGLGNLSAYQGDATDLSRFEDDSFDAVLLLGPMYHLYEKAEQNKALDEAIRVTKPGGVLMTAFLSVYGILYDNYLGSDLSRGLQENFGPDYGVLHFREQGFTGFDVEEFERLFDGKSVRFLSLAGADSLLEFAEQKPDFRMSDDDFELFFAYHLATCEKRELLGTHSHLLYICRKAEQRQ